DDQGQQLALWGGPGSDPDGFDHSYDHAVPEDHKCKGIGGNRMKKSSRFSRIYLGIIFFLMYLPIGVVILFSFNESKLPVALTGFSFRWYEELFADRDMIEALGNSLILGVLSCLLSAGI